MLKFPKFDIVSDFSDHHYAEKQPCTTAVQPSAQKTIMREWRHLSDELPDSIYVRVCETRVEFLRAAIVGARGTPYHDGLFFFDIKLPVDYPARPPNVHYRSFGYRVNPNLYGSGKVCLSLLHTWQGTKSEKWDPTRSNVLQILLSIQALVLNEKPYFNEPGYEKTSGKPESEKASLAYSENAFVLSCKTMLLLLKRPPNHFETLVKQHFFVRSQYILNACDMYRKGLEKVGMFDGLVKQGKGVFKVSSRFKRSLDKLYPDLAAAFPNSPPDELVLEQAEKTDNKKETTKKRKTSLVTKLRNLFVGLMSKKKSKDNQV